MAPLPERSSSQLGRDGCSPLAGSKKKFGIFAEIYGWASAVGPQSRAQIRMSVIVLDDPRAECVVTVEVFDDDSGRTAVIVQIPEDA